MKINYNKISYKACTRLFVVGLCISIGLAFGCKKLISVESPKTNLTSESAFDNDATAIAVLTGLYADISNGDNIQLFAPSSLSGISMNAGLSADELSLGSGVTNVTLLAYHRNNLKSILGTSNHVWAKLYYTVYVSNLALGGLSNSSKLTESVNRQLKGESYFMRAFAYFYLVNLYGEVPLVLTTDYSISATLAKQSKAAIYQQIISDLKEAKQYLNENYLDGTIQKTTTERVRPNKATATALLARSYLYNKQYSEAEIEATSVIENRVLYDTVSLNQVFLKNSRETIWSLPSVRSQLQQNTGQGRVFILPATGPSNFSNPFYLSNSLISSFESADKRRIEWVKSVIVSGNTYPYAYKYKIGSVNTAPAEYLMMFRLGELYLIRAEARANLNKLNAVDDVNIIRRRAGLPNIVVSNTMQLIEGIQHERQVELFTEWGHRWLDLKRTNKVEEVMKNVTPTKGGVWQNEWALYPIPQIEIDRDPFLIQNQGYTN